MNQEPQPIKPVIEQINARLQQERAIGAEVWAILADMPELPPPDPPEYDDPWMFKPDGDTDPRLDKE
ncbi:hypothetical protein [Mycolicibacterium sp. PDY-3]|uniref:hypothetical protein n=1 Tax=Mycolicibacterium sp. PDY-3 TaxID=3376069 RepID=UPI0037882FCC